MVLIQEAAALLYLGSTRQTCRGDGLAVSPLFMDHHPSPISYICLQKSPCLGSRHSVTDCCLSISDFYTFFFTFTFLTNVFLFAAVAVAHAVMFCHVQWQRNDAGPISRPLDGKHGKEIKAFIEMIYEFLHSEMQISV